MIVLLNVFVKGKWNFFSRNNQNYLVRKNNLDKQHQVLGDIYGYIRSRLGYNHSRLDRSAVQDNLQERQEF